MPKTYSHTCQNPNCVKQFHDVHKHREACSLTCAAIMRCIRSGKPPWSSEENNLLEKWAAESKYDVRAIATHLKRHALKNGWAVRTRCAVKDQMQKLGLSAQPTLDNLSMSAIAKILNIQSIRVKRWHYRGMPVTKRNSRFSTVSLKAFKAWARENPVHFYGIDRDLLVWLLEDEALVDLMLERSPRPKGKKQRVRRTDTGEEFPTLAAGCRAAFISQTSLYMGGRDRVVVAGIEWEALNA